MGNMIIYGLLAIFFIWALIVTIIVVRMKMHYSRLVLRTQKTSIDEVLDSILEKTQNTDKQLLETKKTVATLVSETKLHLQKIGFVRFNPFDRVGGEQSFVVTLLDYQDSGIILNFLYTREGVRIYAKKINHGKSEEYELSTEEKEAIKKAH